MLKVKTQPEKVFVYLRSGSIHQLLSIKNRLIKYFIDRKYSNSAFELITKLKEQKISKSNEYR